MSVQNGAKRVRLVVCHMAMHGIEEESREILAIRLPADLPSSRLADSAGFRSDIHKKTTPLPKHYGMLDGGSGRGRNTVCLGQEPLSLIGDELCRCRLPCPHSGPSSMIRHQKCQLIAKDGKAGFVSTSRASQGFIMVDRRE